MSEMNHLKYEIEVLKEETCWLASFCCENDQLNFGTGDSPCEALEDLIASMREMHDVAADHEGEYAEPIERWNTARARFLGLADEPA